ncbi:metal-sulfur cluster assembly factor [Loigolactobacillus zhaoyuanensis]|uniref:metal-sulfur cluster assembly factor n=1 Tax=Loigolactobacillus zhaoyuanensis TaxID=2486017 RepID=UPI000F73F107|nr:metal-sulfur cluster assembly factor [Loigolactobacillus zhaoyuanensis]
MREDIKINDRAAAIGDQLIDKLQTVFDPELGLDVYNLGLIYELDLDENGTLKVITTFTEMVCGCIESMPVDLKAALSKLPDINEVVVDIAWTPRWKMTRISRLGRMALGISVR